MKIINFTGNIHKKIISRSAPVLLAATAAPLCQNSFKNDCFEKSQNIHNITPYEISQKDNNNFFSKFLNNDEKTENLIKNIDYSKYKNQKQGLEIKYTRTEFIKDLNKTLNKMSLGKEQEILSKLNIEINENRDSFNGILNFQNLNSKNPDEKNIKVLCENFIHKNEIATNDNKLNLVLNSLIKGMPEFMNIIGKHQHKTQAYTVDMHMLKVLSESLKNPNYSNLSNEDKTILKFATIMHDIAKSEGVVDNNHVKHSAQYSREILKKYNLSEESKNRITNLIKNHHWLAEYTLKISTTKELASKIGNYNNYEILKIFAKSDLLGVNDNFFLKYGVALNSTIQAPIKKELDNLININTNLI